MHTYSSFHGRHGIFIILYSKQKFLMKLEEFSDSTKKTQDNKNLLIICKTLDIKSTTISKITFRHLFMQVPGLPCSIHQGQYIFLRLLRHVLKLASQLHHPISELPAYRNNKFRQVLSEKKVPCHSKLKPRSTDGCVLSSGRNRTSLPVSVSLTIDKR